MPRPDNEWLDDILDAAIEIQSYVTGVTYEAFASDSMRRNATLQQLTVIGEAAARMTSGIRERHPNVEWMSMIGFRNVAVHGYFRMTWKIVWETATTDIPDLAEQIADILTAEFPPAGPAGPEPVG
ncbi:MAG: hypothetical protein QOF01_785 [Thermomicrobiales bacterium]|jgi:uncharacterized protein with HEPN domain|nr:hypothetical protein [Thermomicrobiales bacterium]MEA2594316.1 hypothetical protein [Thermomicrobiales bacterium]